MSCSFRWCSFDVVRSSKTHPRAGKRRVNDRSRRRHPRTAPRQPRGRRRGARSGAAAGPAGAARAARPAGRPADGRRPVVDELWAGSRRETATKIVQVYVWSSGRRSAGTRSRHGPADTRSSSTLSRSTHAASSGSPRPVHAGMRSRSRGPVLADFRYDPGRRRRSSGSRSCGSRCSRSGSTPTLGRAATRRSRASSTSWSPTTRCGNASRPQISRALPRRPAGRGAAGLPRRAAASWSRSSGWSPGPSFGGSSRRCSHRTSARRAAAGGQSWRRGARRSPRSWSSRRGRRSRGALARARDGGGGVVATRRVERTAAGSRLFGMPGYTRTTRCVRCARPPSSVGPASSSPRETWPRAAPAGDGSAPRGRRRRPARRGRPRRRPNGSCGPPASRWTRRSSAVGTSSSSCARRSSAWSGTRVLTRHVLGRRRHRQVAAGGRACRGTAPARDRPRGP